jgi:YD repeat-containing protein
LGPAFDASSAPATSDGTPGFLTGYTWDGLSRITRIEQRGQ